MTSTCQTQPSHTRHRGASAAFVILIAGLAVSLASLSRYLPAQDPQNVFPLPQEDWHGNVRRSHPEHGGDV